ncbi:hypothetical protein B0J17DRAFT_632740 [Rhizoctonia solani]|nr:hypothetical protein B0J17DRAFT_632740 [Rhizoctonia solani]
MVMTNLYQCLVDVMQPGVGQNIYENIVHLMVLSKGNQIIQLISLMEHLSPTPWWHIGSGTACTFCMHTLQDLAGTEGLNDKSIEWLQEEGLQQARNKFFFVTNRQYMVHEIMTITVDLEGTCWRWPLPTTMYVDGTMQLSMEILVSDTMHKQVGINYNWLLVQVQEVWELQFTVVVTEWEQMDLLNPQVKEHNMELWGEDK